MGAIDSVLDYLVHYPIVPCSFFVLCTLCAIPVVLLLLATQRCALHRNCRFLITFWCISLLGELSDVVLLNVQMLTYDKGYVPLGIVDPPLRPKFLIFHSIFYASGSFFEMFIALERILSAWKPHEYHVSRVQWKVLIPLTIFSYGIGAAVGYLIYHSEHYLVGIILYNFIDVSTLVINTIGIRYCKARYETLYGNASLNARYQVNEAYTMARAMHPIYFGSFLLKGLGIAIAYTYVFLMPHFNGPIYALMDAGYFATHVFNCAFASGSLIFLQKSIRKSVSALLCRSRPHPAQVVPIDTNADNTDAYFEQLPPLRIQRTHRHPSRLFSTSLFFLFFTYSTICSISVVVLSIATQKCALHRNCRYLISFWCISVLGVLLNIVFLKAQTLFYEKGLIPRGLVDPPPLSRRSCFEMFQKKLFQRFVFFEVGLVIPVLLFMTYISIKRRDSPFAEFGSSLVLVILCIIGFYILTVFPARVHSQIKDTRTLFCSNIRQWIPYGQRVHTAALVFSSHLEQNDMGVTLWGFALLSKPLILTSLSAMTTALAIFLQFSECKRKIESGHGNSSLVSSFLLHVTTVIPQ